MHCGYKPPWSELLSGYQVVLILDLTHTAEAAIFNMLYSVHEAGEWRVLSDVRQILVHRRPWQAAMMVNGGPVCIHRMNLIFVYDLIVDNDNYLQTISIACSQSERGDIYMYDGLSELMPLMFQHSFTGCCNMTVLKWRSITRHARIIMITCIDSPQPYKVSVKTQYHVFEEISDHITFNSNVTELKKFQIYGRIKLLWIIKMSFKGFEMGKCLLGGVYIYNRFYKGPLRHIHFCQNETPWFLKKTRYFNFVMKYPLIVCYIPAFASLHFEVSLSPVSEIQTLPLECKGRDEIWLGFPHDVGILGYVLSSEETCNLNLTMAVAVSHTIMIRTTYSSHIVY